MEKSNELTIKNPSHSVEAMILQAIDKGVPVETMEKIMVMGRELRAEFAKNQFDEAMAKFQADCPVIKKSKAGGKTKAGIVAYKYAPLDVIVSQVKKLIAENGFSYAVKTETKKDGVKATCIVKHFAGHSEFSEMEVPFGTKTDIMSQSQYVAAATTFAKRYAFCNAFGILTGDDDNDGQSLKEQPKYQPKPAVKPQIPAISDVIKLKDKLFKLGAKTLPQAINKYNAITGENIKSLSVGPAKAKEMLFALLNNPQSKK